MFLAISEESQWAELLKKINYQTCLIMIRSFCSKYKNYKPKYYLKCWSVKTNLKLLLHLWENFDQADSCLG